MPSMAQFIDESGELEEMNLKSSYEKHMPSLVFIFRELGRRKAKSNFSPVLFWCQLAVESEKVKADGIFSSF